MLFNAIHRRDQNLVNKWLEKLGIDVKIPLKGNPTSEDYIGSPLHLAIGNLDTNMVKMRVLEWGADVNQELIVSGKKTTPLIYALGCLAG